LRGTEWPRNTRLLTNPECVEQATLIIAKGQANYETLSHDQGIRDGVTETEQEWIFYERDIELRPKEAAAAHNISVMIIADVRHQIQVAPMTKGSRKVR